MKPFYKLGEGVHVNHRAESLAVLAAGRAGKWEGACPGGGSGVGAPEPGSLGKGPASSLGMGWDARALRRTWAGKGLPKLSQAREPLGGGGPVAGSWVPPAGFPAQ